MPDFWRHVDKNGPLWNGTNCWVWLQSLKSGYGRFWDGEARHYAHCYSYELLVGKIPDNLQLDHLCRNRACVNPVHLEPVTLQENVRRGNLGKILKTHCKWGHAFDDENTHIRSDGRRRCISCYKNRRK